MDTPQISRSGRVLKKSAKVKEMEDFDINELDVQGKARKKPRLLDEYEEYDDKRVAPIKIPKISLGMQGGSKKKVDVVSIGKQIAKPPFHPNAMKAKQDARLSIYHDSSDGSKESDSSSVSSESSSSSASSSEPSDDEEQYGEFRTEPLKRGLAALPNLTHNYPHERVIVEQHQQRFESPIYMDPSSEPSSDESEDAGSDPALVIAEDSEDESLNYPPRNLKGGMKKRGGKTDPTYAPRQGGPGGRKRSTIKAVDTPAAKKKKPVAKGKPPTAYMLWCSENRKKIVATSGNIGFGNIRKKLGEMWQALPEKEKMAWRRKAKMLAVKDAGNVIITGTSNVQTKTINRNVASISDELMRSPNTNEPLGILGTTPIDSAAHLKLLGDSLTVIGQRLIEHEGQLAVSGIYSVLLDTLLCAVGPLLCLTTQIAGLEDLPQDVFKKTLDHIAYFMPGL